MQVSDASIMIIDYALNKIRNPKSTDVVNSRKSSTGFANLTHLTISLDLFLREKLGNLVPISLSFSPLSSTLVRFAIDVVVALYNKYIWSG